MTELQTTEQEKKRVQDEKVAKIAKIADEVAEANNITRNRFYFQSDWLKTATSLKTIKAQLEEQVRTIIAPDKQKEADKITIEHAAKYYGLEAVGYIEMLDQYSFEEIRNVMIKAVGEKKRDEADAEASAVVDKPAGTVGNTKSAVEQVKQVKVLKVVSSNLVESVAEILVDSTEAIYYVDYPKYGNVRVLQEDFEAVIRYALDNLKGLPTIMGYELPNEDWF